MPAQPATAVDTNVPVTANGDAPQASAECERACREKLREITDGRIRLVLDDRFEIFKEYLSNLSLRGEPGVGDVFLKWVHDHQFNPERCDRVPVAPHPTRGYEQFPDDESLAGFDPADRKFAAVARISRAPVLNAVDSDWWDYERVLSRHGIAVKFACEDQVAVWRATRQQK